MQTTTNKQIIGYTCGVFDLFHIGHLNLLRNAKSLCDKLIVGVSTDDLVKYKHKSPVIPWNDRAMIVQSIKYVDAVIPQDDRDKITAYHKLKYDILFVGDDWYDNQEWKLWEQELHKFGVRVIYFPYTTTTSSTSIVKSAHLKFIEDNK